ncbi:MAG TPA: DJ-1/PfpI family protein [Thermoleophilaceae bacterium]|jgi:transcriptional regulator GlxA family with amidase domain
MQVAIPIYDKFTALDCVGPYEVLSRLPGAEVKFLAAEAGPVRTETRMLSIVAEGVYEDMPNPEVLVVPGGFGTRRLLDDDRILDWIRGVHETSEWTTSVCTGALLLGAAGILDGLEATTHWVELPNLAHFGAHPSESRVIEQGKVITAAGVSAGIDMALTLAARIAGDEVAQAIQLGIEYDPQPPFDAGSPAKAPKAAADLVRAIEAAQT